MVPNPKKRLSATQAKKHAWFKNAKKLKKKLQTGENYSLSLSTGPAEVWREEREGKREGENYSLSIGLIFFFRCINY